jgi:PPOX class probable F420-dependent enzyme
VIDESALSERDGRRLREDLAVWLVTVRADGMPQPTPVWFVWDGSTLLIYSQPGKPKLVNIASNPNVSLHFNSDPDGEDVLIVFGNAELDPTAPPMIKNPAYLQKYKKGISDIDLTPETASAEYSQPVRIEPTSFRAW